MLQNQRIYLWDNLKVILMIMVVLTHCIVPYQLQGDRWVQFLWIFIMTFTMPLFTLISGYFYKERTINFSIYRYLYPCIMFSILNIFIGVASGAYPNGIPLKVGYAMWYLWVLFIYNIVTPVLLKFFDEKKLLVIAFVIAFICGFKCVSNNFFDIPRIMSFYLFFVLGIVLKKNNLQFEPRLGLFCMVICVFIYILLTMKVNGFPYGTGFMGCHGMHMNGFVFRWVNYILTILMSLSLIAIMPNKKYYFSCFGTRTMNVYLLHMAFVFPLCWFLLKPYMNSLLGYALNIIVIPTLVCAFLFSEFVDRKMQIILSMPRKMLQVK